MHMENDFLQVEMLDNEFWWGCCVYDGLKMPISNLSEYDRNIDPNDTMNQAAPLLLSSKGRYIWCDRGFSLKVSKGVIAIECTKAPAKLYEGFCTLRGAFLEASKKHFPPDGRAPDDVFFKSPQYNTWIEFQYDQNQDGIMEYARNIIKNNLPVGLIMIDCGWQEYYGNWEFHTGRFSNPRKMVQQLHDMGFSVMLWVCPFVTPDTALFRKLRNENFFIKDNHGKIALREWWDGYSAVLDFTNPAAISWFKEQLDRLMDCYDIDGFKFDAGDACFYKDNDQLFSKTDANGQSELWAILGSNYRFNEYRACFKCAGLPIVQRLCDKLHKWEGEAGLAALIPDSLAQGIIGYPYTCADMIGGGEYQDFLKNAVSLDDELFVRYAQCTALMPMMQFSAAPWRVLDDEHFAICKEMAWLHVEISSEMIKLAHNSQKTGEPIIRYMDYVFPGQNLESITDQFMIGDKIIVAPNLQKGNCKRMVAFPEGEWVGEDSMHIKGPAIVEIDVPLERCPRFERKQRN